MSAEIESFHLASSRDRQMGMVQLHRFAPGRTLQQAGRTVRVGISDKEHRVLWIVDEAEGKVIARGVLSHHAAAERVNAARRITDIALAAFSPDNSSH